VECPLGAKGNGGKGVEIQISDPDIKHNIETLNWDGMQNRVWNIRTDTWRGPETQ